LLSITLLSGTLRLHDVVNQVIEVLFIDLLISTLHLFRLILGRHQVVDAVLATRLTIPILIWSKVTKEVVSCDTSTHATTVDCSLFVRFVLLTIIIIITAYGVLLGLLLLLIINLLLEGSRLGLSVRDFRLFLTFELLGTLCFDLLLGVLVQVDVKVSLSFKRLVRVGDELGLFFDFSNLL
jgi:hypothetical protein